MFNVKCAAVLILFISIAGCVESDNPMKDVRSWKNDSEVKFEKGSDLPPTAKTLYYTAVLLARQGKDSEGELVLKKCIRDYPKFSPAYNSLAELQMRQGRIKEAIHALSTAISVYPDDPVVLNNLGMCRLIREDYEKALEMFIRACGIIPEKKKYRANMAVALGLMGRDEEALSLYKQILPSNSAKLNIQVLQEARKNTIQRFGAHTAQ